MKLDEYLQKKKQIEEAEKKLGLAKVELKKEKIRNLEEKGAFWYGWKPWVKNDAIIVILMIVLFLIATFYNPGTSSSSDSNDNGKGGFFSNLFGLGNKDNTTSDTSSNEDVSNTDNTDTTIDTDTSGGTGETASNTDNGEVSSSLVDYDMGVYYNDQSVIALRVPANMNYIWYNVKITNNEAEKIKCDGYEYINDVEGDYNSFSVDTDEPRNLAFKALRDSGTDLTMKYKFNCYVESNKEETQLEKEVSVKVTFL